MTNAAVFDGKNWYSMGLGLAGVLINSLQVYKDKIYAGSLGNYTSGSFKTPANLFTYNITALGIDKQSSENFVSVYYDETLRLIKIKSDEHAELTLLDMLGKQVWQGILSKDQPLPFNHPGIFLAKVVSGKGSFTQKILVP